MLIATTEAVVVTHRLMPGNDSRLHAYFHERELIDVYQQTPGSPLGIGGAVPMITVVTTDDDDNQAVKMQTLWTHYFFEIVFL